MSDLAKAAQQQREIAQRIWDIRMGIALEKLTGQKGYFGAQVPFINKILSFVPAKRTDHE